MCPVEGGPSRRATLTGAKILHAVRRMRFAERYARRQRRELTMGEAAEMRGGGDRANVSALE